MAHIIDPTITGDYPVILGDGLLGNPSNEIFTGIRYNHKPELTSDAKLKPSVAGKTTSYDLSFNDPKGTHTFTGTRTTENDDYVLYFDPQRKAFILDKVDSTFDMNITRLPGNYTSEDLRRQYPHLEKPKPLKHESMKKTTDKDKPKPAAANKDKAPGPPRARKNEKKQQPKKFDLALPMPIPEQPKPEPQPETKSRSKKHEDEDEEEEDDDGDLLLVEYPGSENLSRTNNFSAAPALARPRRFDDFMDQRESEADDADGESDEEPRMIPKLPSPVIHHQSQIHHRGNGHADAADDGEIDAAELERAFEDDAQGDAEDLEDDLAKEMEEAFEHLHASRNGGVEQDASPDGDESEISEED